MPEADSTEAEAGVVNVRNDVVNNWPKNKKGANALKKEFKAINQLGCPL